MISKDAAQFPPAQGDRSQEELLEHVWDENADPFTNTVRVTVGTLRRKLEAVRPDTLIETVVGRGYRLLDGSSEAD